MSKSVLSSLTSNIERKFRESERRYRRNELVLREREQRLQLALTAAQLHIWTVDLRNGRINASDGVKKICGLLVDEHVRRGSWWRRVFPSDRARVWSAYRMLIQNNAPFDVEYRVRRPNGEIRWVDSQAIVLRDERDQPFQIYGVAVDITRQKETERELYRRQQEFKTLVENAPDIISRIDRDLRHLYVNPAVQSAWGIDAGRYLGRTHADLELPESLVRPWRDAARAAFAHGKEQRFNFSFFDGDSIRYYSTRLIPEFDRDGRVESLLGITYDETERTEVELERDALLVREQAARVQAEAATRARDEFLAVVSHELRSPLNGIQSWAHVLEIQLPAQSSSVLRRALQGIRTGVSQQVRLIEDLLDMTRMLSGTLRLVKQPMPILPVVESAVESVRSLAAAKRIAIDVAYESENGQVEGDRDRLQQIIWNLLSNAIKFTPEDGRVWLTVSTVDESVCITVRDNGKGISPDFLPSLFLRFQQADTSSTRGHDGLGLGLSLVRHLIELHQGRITAESAGEGKGATFQIYLPLRRALDLSPPHGPVADRSLEPQLPSLEGTRILLIDDQEEARESLLTLLRQSGALVAASASGKDALRQLQTTDEPPHVLLCDIAMPDEDGYAVLRQIRLWEKLNKSSPRQLPAIALTAFTQKDDRLRALSSGFQAHLTKPVAPRELVAEIFHVLGRSEPGVTRPQRL